MSSVSNTQPNKDRFMTSQLNHSSTSLDTVDTALSYAAGRTDLPLLEETIGDEPPPDLQHRTATGRRSSMCPPAAGGRTPQFQHEVDALARGLLRIGLQKGDRVGIWAGNCPEWTMLQYATADIGAILVTINPAYRRHELGYVLNQSGVRLLVAARSMKGVDHAAMIDDVAPGLSRPRTRRADRRLRSGTGCRIAPVDDDDLRARQATLSPHDPINIQYTSGTTGHPKGATLTHHNILNNAYFVGETCGYTAADRVCVPVPLFHTFGMVLGNLGATTHGACLVYPAPSFEPRATLVAVAQERCTSLYGVPAMFIAELADPELRRATT